MDAAHPLSNSGLGEVDFKTLWNQAIRPALAAGAETVVGEAFEKVVEIPEVQARAIEASKTGIKATLSRGVDWVYSHPVKAAVYTGIPAVLILSFVGYKVIK